MDGDAADVADRFVHAPFEPKAARQANRAGNHQEQGKQLVLGIVGRPKDRDV